MSHFSVPTPVNCVQAAELLKLLLDPETMDTPVEKNDFLESFYDKSVRCTHSTCIRTIPLMPWTNP